MNPEEAKIKYGQRIQRCYGCFGAFYLKDMWLGVDATYYCENCKGDSMFHFDEFTRKLDITKLPSMNSEEEESTQCQNPFTRQQ
jgi:hypothetical protein